MSSPSRAACAFVTILATAVVVAFSCSSVFAAKVYVPGVSFGSEGSGPGQFKEPVGVAVNEASPLVEPVAGGDVYVVDKGNARVERFSASGEYKGQFNGSGEYEVEGKKETGVAAPTGTFSGPGQIAVDSDESGPSFGEVYVIDPGHDVIDEFSATGEYKGQLTPADMCNPTDCKFKKELGQGALRNEKLTGVNVDPSGNIWTSDLVREEIPNGESQGITFVDECGDTGGCVTKFPFYGGDVEGMGVDSSDNLYVLTGSQIVRVALSGEVKGEIQAKSHSSRPLAFAVDLLASDTLFDEGDSVALFAPIAEGAIAKSPIETFPTEGLAESHGIAVNSASVETTAYATELDAGRVETFNYLSLPTVATQAPSGVSETALTLHGTVEPEGEPVSECYFEYGSEAGVYTNRVPCSPAAPFSGTASSVSVSAELSGLPPASVRSFRLAAANANGLAHTHGATIGRPAPSGESFSNVGVIGATLSAQIDPGNLPTTYRIEYGTSTSYGTSTPEENIGEGGVGVPVRVDLAGLRPATRYHFRIVARNALGTTDGPDVSFGTYVSVAGLPDGRVYEPVTSVGSIQDENIYVPQAYFIFTPFGEHGIFASGLSFQAAAGGEAVVYVGDPPASGGTGCAGLCGGNEYLSTRLPDGGWTQVALETESNGSADGYRAFTSDLSVGILEGSNIPGTGVIQGYDRFYAHAMAGGVGGEYDPLFTAVPDRPRGELDVTTYSTTLYAGANAGTGAVPTSSHLLFESNAGLLEGEGELEKELDEDVRKEVEEGKHSELGLVHYLYDSVGGRSYLVDVLPNGHVAPGASFGAVQPGLTPNGIPGDGPGFTHVISADGSRVFWTAAPEAFVNTHTRSSELAPVEKRSRALYVRENDTQRQSPLGPEEECLVATDACTVQVDAAVGGGGIFQGASSDGSKVFFTKGNLYEYDLETAETTDLSPDVEVKGVAGISENGEYVYYVDSSDDIVLWHAGATTRVASGGANSSDYPSGNAAVASDYAEEIGSRTAEITPNGQNLVFMSNVSLTGYDNRGFKKMANHIGLVEEAIEEVYLYEAQSGKLTCVSCNPTGEAPVPTNASTGTAVSIQSGEETGLVGAELPVSLKPTYQPRWISEDGSRVFFSSAQPLAPQATNGWLDVYEWERDGSGSCQQSEGCIYLLSSGSDPENTYLLDASASGNDVFMITRAQLVAQDRNDLFDVYDARVDGVRPTAPPECSGTGCQGVPPAPPIFATPASVTFEGIGNFPPTAPVPPKKKTAIKSRCAKPKKRSHSKCVRAKAKGTIGKHRSKTMKSDRSLKSDRGSK